MSKYIPTTNEVETGFTTYAWMLEKECPGEYGENTGFDDYYEVSRAFNRWLAQVKAEAWAEGFAHSVRTNFHSKMPRLSDNPYRKGGFTE